MRAFCFSAGVRVPSWFVSSRLKDFLYGAISVVAFKRFHVHARWIRLTQAGRKLHFAVDNIVMADESADETNDNGGRLGAGRFGRGCKCAGPGRKSRSSRWYDLTERKNG